MKTRRWQSNEKTRHLQSTCEASAKHLRSTCEAPRRDPRKLGHFPKAGQGVSTAGGGIDTIHPKGSPQPPAAHPQTDSPPDPAPKEPTHLLHSRTCTWGNLRGGCCGKWRCLQKTQKTQIPCEPTFLIFPNLNQITSLVMSRRESMIL